MFHSAVEIHAAGDAAAAIACAQRSERRVRALVIFIAFVADPAPLIAAVGVCGAFELLATNSKAAISQGVAGVPRRAITHDEAGDAAMTLGVAAQCPVVPTVRVAGALVAFALDAAKGARTFWVHAAVEAEASFSRHTNAARHGPTTASVRAAAGAAATVGVCL